MKLKPLKTKRDHALALKRIEKLWDAKANTVKGDEIDILATLVTVYE